jgi:hypothetical protein
VTYHSLPKLGSLPAPELPFHRSPNQSTRAGRHVRLIFLHVWGGGTFESTSAWLCNPQAQASAHVVYGGEGQATQLVGWGEKAWTECDLNPVGISIESADAIWHGHDADGFAQLARLTALLCHLHLGVCRYVPAAGIVSGMHGFTRHADAGALGCGHLSCPTTDLALWDQFCGRVIGEYRLGGFRAEYGVS